MEGKDDVSLALTGSAVIAPNVQFLSKSQRDTLLRLVENVQTVASEEALRQSGFESLDDYVKAQWERRPRHAYLIDGPRGGGKTTVLLTARELIQGIGQGEDERRAHRQIRDLVTLRREEHKERTGAQAEPALKHSLFETISVRTKKRTQPVCALPPIFPADVNEGESILEAVFAHIRESVQAEVKRREDLGGKTADEGRKEGEELANRLEQKVAGSWRLSRQEGRAVVQGDSFNVEDFLRHSAEYDARSQRRVELWREFVNHYLEFVGAQVLALFFDDTDTQPKETFELLHAVRIFLDHPRIVTIVAGNLKSMRRSLILHHRAAPGRWGERSRGGGAQEYELDRHVEEYLEKLLPAPNRFYLKRPRPPRRLPTPDQGKSKQPSGVDTGIIEEFDKYCVGQLRACRMRFITEKLRSWHGPLYTLDATVAEKAGLLKIPVAHGVARRGAQPPAIERYVSWWLLRHFYWEDFSPRTMRQLVQVQRYTQPSLVKRPDTDENEDFTNPKRLAVMLFEVSANSRLIRQFGDDDDNVLSWLHQQQVSSGWTGDRYFRIGEERFYQGTYEHSYLCYRIDLGIAAPILDNPDEDIPVGLLPNPHLLSVDLTGRKLTRSMEEWTRTARWQAWRQDTYKKLRRPTKERSISKVGPHEAPRQRRFGVAKSRHLDHPVIPANCVYMFDLLALNQWLWRSEAPEERAQRPTRWAPSEMHHHIDYETARLHPVLDDEKQFSKLRSYADVYRAKTERGDTSPLTRGDFENGEWFTEEMKQRRRDERRQQRRAISDYVRKAVVPLASIANLRAWDQFPSDDVRWWPEARAYRLRGKALRRYLEILAVPLSRIEQWTGHRRRRNDADAAASEEHREQNLANAWAQLGDDLRERPGWRTAVAQTPQEARRAYIEWKLDLRKRKRRIESEAELYFGELFPFAPLLNDLLGSYFAVRVFERQMAVVLRAAHLDDLMRLSPKRAKEERRREALSSFKVLQGFIKRNEQFAPLEGARLITLEDLQTIVGVMGDIGVTPPYSHHDLPRLIETIEGGDSPELATQWQKALAQFIVRAFQKNAAGEPGEVIGFNRPYEGEAEADAKLKPVSDLLKALFGNKDDLPKNPAERIESWKKLLTLCAPQIVGKLRNWRAIDDPTDVAHWMWPEYRSNATPARCARVFLLFVYGLSPYLRSLYELDREAFLTSGGTDDQRQKDEPPSVEDWRQSGRPLMWLELAASLRYFVRRFGTVLRLTRMRMELHYLAYGDSEAEPRVTGVKDLQRQIEDMLKSRPGDTIPDDEEEAMAGGRWGDEVEKSKDPTQTFHDTCGFQFMLTPDISHESLGVELGPRGDERYEPTGMVDFCFETLGSFIDYYADDVPKNQRPRPPTPPKPPKPPAKGGGKKRPTP